jgi:SAM-dependent methyltransferase
MEAAEARCSCPSSFRRYNPAMPNHERQDPVGREAAIQGSRWQSLHRGYFSSRAIAEPLVDAAAAILAADRPDVVADLGGGTGEVLHEIARRCPKMPIRLVNVDLSARQLAEIHDHRIESLEASVEAVRRDDLRVGDGRLMLLMRSVLHYFGADGLRPVLRQIRAQLKATEAFVHQTACFLDAPDARCANRLYELMRTDKWYPSQAELEEILHQTGWTVEAVRFTPPLALESADLAERYQLSAGDVADIRRRMSAEFGNAPEVFHAKDDGFIAWLHYAILVCRAA